MYTIKKKTLILLALLLALSPLAAEIKIGFTGYLDADVVTDFKGNHTAAHEFDLSMGLDFGSGVKVTLSATSYSGRVPAVGQDAADRWTDILFDGLNVALKDKLGAGTTIELIDVGFQYGKMDAYYFYKRLSLITPEAYLRGAAFSKESGKNAFRVLAGLDGGDKAILSGSAKLSGLSVMATYMETAYDPGTGGIGLLSFGATCEGLPAGIKLIAGFLTPVVAGTPEFGDAALNLAASFSVSLGGNFSLAGFFLFTKDDYGINGNILNVVPGTGGVGAFEQILAYVEPGYKISKHLAVGLPLEWHKWDGVSDKQIWIVPTLYIYPVDGVEIWLWGQAVLHSTSGADPDFYAGIESIIKF